MREDILKQLQELPADMQTLSMAAVALAAENGSVSVDDLRSAIKIQGDLKILGAVVAQLGRKGVLQKIGYQSSKQKSAGQRPIFSYALTDDWRSAWLTKMPQGYPAPVWMMDLKAVITVTKEGDAFEHLKAMLDALKHYEGLNPNNQLPPSMWEQVAAAKSYVENLARARQHIESQEVVP